jgi:hypothetical protein
MAKLFRDGCIAGLAYLLLSMTPALAQAPLPLPDEKPAQQADGITALPKGPVHEAYAQPFNKNPQATPVVPKQPPPPIPEQPPDQKPQGNNAQWIPGYWSWDGERNDFVWVSGFWRVMPPNRSWVPGYWNQANGGWQWVSGYWGNMQIFNPQAPEVDNLVPTPPNSVDNGPNVPAPNDNMFYVPGSWVFRDSRYMWRPGYWSPAYADWVWNPAYYSWTPNGAVYVDGFWDYPLTDRGLLFAPVAFNRPLWLTAGWRYRPWWTVDVGGLFNSLWVRPGWGSYYYGDYYAPGYVNLGFYPWWSYGRRFYDPLWGYYGWYHRNDRGWWDGYRNSFYARRDGFRNTTVVAHTNILRPLNQVHTNLARANTANRVQASNHSQNYGEVTNARIQAERSFNPAAARNVYGAGAGGHYYSSASSGGSRQSYYHSPAAEHRPSASYAAHAEAPHYQSSAHVSHANPHPAPAFHGGSPGVHHSAPASHGGGGHSGGGNHGNGGSSHHK